MPDKVCALGEARRKLPKLSQALNHNESSGVESMQTAIRTKTAKLFLVSVEAAIFLVLAAWVSKAYIANVLASKPTVDNLEHALKLDPGSAEYHMRLGRLYEYNPPNMQLEKAQDHFRRAIQLDSYNPQTWLELAAALEFQGKIVEAGACLRQVDLLAPNLLAYQWPIANFYLLQGSIDEAFRHFRVVLAGTSQYDSNVFGLAWKATDDAGKILQQLIPERVATEFSYLNFLISGHRLNEAQAVWKRIVAGREAFSPDQSSPYIDSLIGAQRADEAYQVWTDLQKKGLIRYSSLPSEKNLISNGEFEDELLNMGFDWRIIPVEGVYAGLDTSTYHSPSHALLVQFTGKQNLHYLHVYQYVKVSPGQSYRLQAFMKTDGITTDSGPRLEVHDAYNAVALNRLTDDLTGTSDGWTSLLLDFATGPKTALIVVRLVRLPSKKFDNLIAGKVWLDDVQLTPVQK
jgi:tetratricopeptide (TPR) repeat protein